MEFRVHRSRARGAKAADLLFRSHRSAPFAAEIGAPIALGASPSVLDNIYFRRAGGGVRATIFEGHNRGKLPGKPGLAL